MKIASALLLLFFLSTTTAMGQLYASSQDDTTGTARIGLVLSGGGAKCFSQIGVLKVMEEAGIQIDYIAGTSMGAIVGGLYALGYSAEEMETYLRAVHWDRLLNDVVPRNRLSYFERKNQGRYLVALPFEKFKVKMPTGINYAQYILTELSYLTQQSYHYPSFKEYPIPFMCMGTNLITGELKIFDNGHLAEALRASSSFPSLYVPYEIDNEVYVDGGVINNYPVVPLLEEADMDYIIGIDLQDFLYEKSEIESAAQVLEQISSFINAAEELHQMQYTDLLIEPRLPENAGITSFDLIDTIIKAGEHAARQHWEGLRYLASLQKNRPKRDTASSPNWQATPLEKFWVEEIHISGNQNISKDFIRRKLRLPEQDTLYQSDIKLAIDRLYGSGYFNKITYQTRPGMKGLDLHFQVEENPSLARLKLGIHYDSDYQSAALVNYSTQNLLFQNSQLSVDFALGQSPRLLAHYFVDRGLIPSLGLKVRSNRFNFRTYENFKPVNERRYFDISNQVYFQSTIADAYAVGGGIEFDYVDINRDINPQEIEGLNESFLNYFAFLDFDSFDDQDLPRHGFQFNGTYRIISGRRGINNVFIEPTSIIEGSFSKAFAFSKRWTLQTSLRGNATIGQSTEAPYKIYLGSLGHNYINYHYAFAGYRFRELIGDNLILARLDVRYEMLPKQYITFTTNAARMESSFDNLFNSSILLDGFALGYTFDSPLGPLSLHFMSSTNHSETYGYLSLGHWF